LVQLATAERTILGRPLHLDEGTGAGHDDVHVGSRSRVLDVGEVENRRPVDDADRDGRTFLDERMAADGAGVHDPAQRIMKGDVATGYRGGSGATVGLEHIAVD